MLELGSEFSYQCNQCNRCCYDKFIPINPYDLIRLSAECDMTTGQFIERYTDDGTVLLRREQDPGTPCVFLGEQGCTVHPNRPFVCRIYPLGQHTRTDGTDYFIQMTPHPETAGIYGSDGVVLDYIHRQGLEQYREVAREYQELFKEVHISASVIAEMDQEVEPESNKLHHLLDVDAWVAEFCLQSGKPHPTTLEQKARMHMEAVRAWLGEIAPRLQAPPLNSSF